MQTLVYQAEVKQAVAEQGVKPKNPVRIYKLVLAGDTEADFEILAEILEGLKDRARRSGALIVEEEAGNSVKKSKAAKNN